MDDLCTFKTKIERQNLKHWCVKDQYPKQIKIKMPNSNQEPPASFKASNEFSKDMDVLCTFKIKIESKNLDHGYIKDKWPYPNQDQDSKPQSGTSNVLQSPKWGLKGHGCSLHLQNQDREPKLGSWIYQRPVIISIWRSRHQIPLKPQIRTWRILKIESYYFEDGSVWSQG